MQLQYVIGVCDASEVGNSLNSFSVIRDVSRGGSFAQ